MYFKISVIVPCYNADLTLKRAIDSIINQNIGFSNIELILYDDSSTDNTKNIIENYSKKHKNIVSIYSNVNYGPGKAKDECLKVAKGKYVMFLDADDEFNETMCQELLNWINDDVDIVSCNYEMIDEISSKIVHIRTDLGTKLNNTLVLNSNDLIYFPSFLVWNKMFKRDIIIKNNITFTNLRNGEDELFLKKYYLHSKNLVYLRDYCGVKHYVINDSISHSQNIDDLFALLDLCKQIISLYESRDVNNSLLVKHRIYMLFNTLYLTDVLGGKGNIYKFFDSLKLFEEEISFNGSLGLICDIPNFFIMHGYFKIALFYFKVLYTLRKSKFVIMLFRRLR